MSRPPASVAFIAWTHWLLSAAVLGGVLMVHLIVRRLSFLVLSDQAYAITLGLAALYAITGALVWRGLAAGRWLNYGCSLLYFVRPQLGSKIWTIMRSEEYRAHFAPRET